MPWPEQIHIFIAILIVQDTANNSEAHIQETVAEELIITTLPLTEAAPETHTAEKAHRPGVRPGQPCQVL